MNCKRCQTENSSTNKYCSGCGYELPKETEPKTIVLTDSQSTLETKTSKQKTLTIVIGIIAFGVSYFAVQQLFFKTPSVDKIMMEVASEINKSCPIMVDQETRLDNSVALPENTFQYNYTLINLNKSEIDTQTLREHLEPGINNNIRTSPDMEFYRNNKVNMVYNYRDKKGVFVLKITSSPEQYN